jgi:putative peptidoglycan lipid II flippase
LSEPVKDASVEPSEGGQAGGGRRFLRAAGLVSAATLLSRLLGVVREQVFAALLGAGLHSDAFRIAFLIPNLLRDLFAEGALSAAFVPTYARALHEGGPASAHRLASRLLTLLAAVLGALVVLGLVLTEPLVSALAPGFDEIPRKAELTVFLTRVMLPFLPLVSFAAVAMGMLNAEGRFGRPALAPAMFNVAAIACGLALAAAGLRLDQVVLGWAIGTLLGGLAQLLVQVPELRRGGWRFKAEWAPRDAGLRQIGRLMAPATVGLAAVQINIFVSRIFASHEPGAVSWLDYAFRILYLPIGIFGVALGTIATSGLARQAASGDLDGVRRILRQSLRMVAFLTLPATAGLIVSGEPIVRLLYQRGRFGAGDTAHTATALALYAVGLAAYTAVKVLAPAFYALGTPRVPLLASAAAVVTNLAVILALHGRLGYRAVALGTGLGSILNVLILLVSFERTVGGLRGGGLAPALAKMLAAAALMTPATWGAVRLSESWAGAGAWITLARGLFPVAVGVACYGLAALALRIPEVAQLRAAFRRRP